jgi:hypothetical protein
VRNEYETLVGEPQKEEQLERNRPIEDNIKIGFK